MCHGLYNHKVVACNVWGEIEILALLQVSNQEPLLGECVVAHTLRYDKVVYMLTLSVTPVRI